MVYIYLINALSFIFNCKFVFILDDVLAECMLIFFFFKMLEAPLAHFSLLNIRIILKVLLEDGQQAKNILLIVLNPPFLMVFDQLLQLLFNHCELQGKIVLSSQYLYYFAKSETTFEYRIVRCHKLPCLWECADVAQPWCLPNALDLLVEGGQIF